MPELPEVETTLRGIRPMLKNTAITRIETRVPKLRYPVPDVSGVKNVPIIKSWRRSKYIGLDLGNQHSLLIHLGMSGRLVLNTPPAKHDHVLIHLANNTLITLNDPRRFGMLLYEPTASLPNHPLLAKLGPEPLTDAFDAAHLLATIQRRTSAIKVVLMDAAVVVGVGNIYANEALFRAGIKPTRPASKITKAEAARLVAEIKAVLTEAIEAGGSSLRDYVQSDGKLGYFQFNFFVYDQAGKPCKKCGTSIKRQVIGQRATYVCAQCQPR